MSSAPRAVPPCAVPPPIVPTPSTSKTSPPLSASTRSSPPCTVTLTASTSHPTATTATTTVDPSACTAEDPIHPGHHGQNVPKSLSQHTSVKQEPVKHSVIPPSTPVTRLTTPTPLTPVRTPPRHRITHPKSGTAPTTMSNTATIASGSIAVMSQPSSLHATPRQQPQTHPPLNDPSTNPDYDCLHAAHATQQPPPSPATPRKSKGGRKAANPHLTEEQRRQERVLKNRESAMKSLQKKKRYTQHLEHRAVALAARNAELRDKIRLLLLRLNHLNPPPPSSASATPTSGALPTSSFRITSPPSASHHTRYGDTTPASAAAAAAATTAAAVATTTPPSSLPCSRTSTCVSRPMSCAMPCPPVPPPPPPPPEIVLKGVVAGDSHWRAALANFAQPAPILQSDGQGSDYDLYANMRTISLPDSPCASLESPSPSVSTIEHGPIATNPAVHF